MKLSFSYPSIAVFHGSILGQTYGTLQALISLALLFVPKPTLCENTPRLMSFMVVLPLRLRQMKREKFNLSREENIRIVETYLNGLADKTLSKVPFAMDVTFTGPRVPPLAGRDAVVGFLSMILPAIRSVHIGEHLADGDYVATTFVMETNGGTDSVFDRIRIVNAEIKSIQSFYYPQSVQS